MEITVNGWDHVPQYFDQSCKTFSKSHLAASWESWESQYKRFLRTTECCDVSNSSILDVGCGWGGLQDVLSLSYDNFDYCGIDISEEMIKKAKSLRPYLNFVNEDFLSYEFERPFDFVFANGTFNLKVDNQDKYIRMCLNRLFELCEKGVFVNLTAHLTPDETWDKGICYYSPVAILEHCFSLTPHIKVDSTYRKNEFLIELYKS
jgi:cyclopropane fatty-acyl-phospholipid synthase-like methyltransferase